MLCRLVRSNPHRGGVASRPGYEENELEAREEKERELTENPPENPQEERLENHEEREGQREEEPAAPGA